MSEDHFYEITALRAQLEAVTKERDEAIKEKYPCGDSFNSREAARIVSAVAARLDAAKDCCCACPCHGREA